MSPSFLNNVARVARSSQGGSSAETTVRRARDPKTRRQIEHVRARLAQGAARRTAATR